MFSFVDRLIRKAITRIVKFDNGKYGVMSWNLFFSKQYLDLTTQKRDYWWNKENQVLEYCQSEFIEDAIECRDLYIYGYEIPVKYNGLAEIIQDKDLEYELAQQRLRGVIPVKPNK